MKMNVYMTTQPPPSPPRDDDESEKESPSYEDVHNSGDGPGNLK